MHPVFHRLKKSGSDLMKKSESHISSEKTSRKRKKNAPNARDLKKRFDPEVEQWFDSDGNAFPSSQSSIIPMLQSAQATLGYLPRDAMQAIASHLCVPPAQVEGIASFYSQFRFNKPGINLSNGWNATQTEQLFRQVCETN
jgi:NADH:ubiquinone oxidoreductase subunit E